MQLMEILKANEIRGYSHYSKLKLIDLLIKRGLIPEKHGKNNQEKIIKDIDPEIDQTLALHRNFFNSCTHDRRWMDF